MNRWAFSVALAIVVGLGLAPATADARAFRLPPVRHVFVVNLENKGFDQTFGPASVATYLSRTLRAKGALLSQYHGTAHESLPNYVAQISGQGPNVQTQADCQVYTDFARVATTADGQAVGTGCVYPADVPTLPGQLSARGRTWKAYMEDMGTPCRHPQIGARDETQQAKVGDQYAARHDPFVYFHSIIDSPSCAANVRDASELPRDLTAINTTPNLSFITPNLCNDGHDAQCVDGRTGGLVAADAWLATWIPKILASPAFKRDGMLIVTFDEAEADQSTFDASACCGEGPGPNSPLPGILGLGGGRTGAVVVSRWTTANHVDDTPYNHYTLLRTIEDIFGLGRIGYANTPGVADFGASVFDRG